jgi:hypothetical protein
MPTGTLNITRVLDKLHQLAELDIHSIEQPIPAGQWQGKWQDYAPSLPYPSHWMKN